ncbi:kynureninase [Hugenholtzia roseola]|uniref:kynureninase n=1 Tax=Hugenholtzia roseola TaxID=1002 RepID=UPI000423536F|nr:kynureninase [Hugenholtzia roseola]
MQATRQYAQQADANDTLRSFRQAFYFPQFKGRDVLYFCGNSLGLQPKTALSYLMQEMEDWKNLGVEGHFQGRNPWFEYHKFVSPKAARLVGAKEVEVVVMNNLTVNLHLMLISFYRPTAQRYKIMVEGGAFPSDYYAVESQLRLHGFSPETAMVELEPRAGEHTLRTEDILAAIEKEGDSLALVLLGGVNYYTGQFFDLKRITEKAHQVGAKAGYDLAHAAGNVPLSLHEWQVDFAVWCTYKYLNSGAGGTSGVFVHEKYAQDPTLHRLAGWWGYDESKRFQMQKGFIPMQGAAGWQLSNAQILPMALHWASLEIFEQAGMDRLRQKSLALTAYTEFLVQQFNQEQDKIRIQIITPAEKEARGCQLSLVVAQKGKDLHQFLTENGVIADWREPDVIRIAPVPLYNSFEDVYDFYQLLQQYTQS